MKIVLECLLRLKAHFMPKVAVGSPNATSPNNWRSDVVRWKQLDEHSGTGDGYQEEISLRTYATLVVGDDRRKGGSPDSKVQRALHNPVMSEPTNALIHHTGHKFHEVFQMKHGGYCDLPAAKVSELMKSNSLDVISLVRDCPNTVASKHHGKWDSRRKHQQEEW